MRIRKCTICGKDFECHKKLSNTKIVCRECTIEKQREEGKQNFIKRLAERYPNFEYVKGYTNSDGWVNIRCKKCGTMKLVKAQIIRSKKNTVCQECLNQEKQVNSQIKELLKQQRESIEEIKKQHRMEINNLYKEIKKNTIYITKCKCCNDDIYSHYKQKTICNRCKSRIKSNHSNKSLMQLYERDKGICYLCGKKCDYEDYVYRENTFIAGNYYPSIDHVIPLAKGGLDVWENLKLAHRICNSKKRDKLLIRPNA